MSVTDVERGLLARYLQRVLSRPELPLRSARQLLSWLHERADTLGLPLPVALAEVVGTYYVPGAPSAQFETVYTRHRAELVDTLERAALETPRPEPLATNIEWLKEALDLPPETLKIVGLIACYSRFDLIMYLTNAVVEAARPMPRAIAYLVGEPARRVEELLAPSSDIVISGLVQLRDGDMVAGHGGRYAIPFRVNSRLDQTYKSFAEMRNALLGDPLESEMRATDYDHVAADRDLLTGVLNGAARESVRGVNILIYGPPGSGKTELAKVAAAEAGLTLFAAGEDSPHDGGEADRSGRLADLVFFERLLSEQRCTGILFDEMEDVAVHLIRRGGSKVYLNRLLETNPVPTLWTSNDISNIDPALLRRMTLAIELKRPPAAQRRRILMQQVRRIGVALSDAEVDRLALRLDATPAILENALRAARLSGGGASAVERAALGILRAVSGHPTRQPGVIPEFDPLLTRASLDLVALADQLVAGESRAFSLCLSGPPGTGKSAYARYLARRLGLEILQKRASDIFGPYLGQTERQTADAFEEARDAGAFLVFDEADSLLSDRREALRSWEISQVNEMLTWMEEHPLPVAFTTNLMERIDTASLRRFTFHVELGYLDKVALARAWSLFLGIERAPAAGLAFENLTPGDFTKARKQAQVLGVLGEPARLVDLLGEISRAKPDARGGFGFVT